MSAASLTISELKEKYANRSLTPVQAVREVAASMRAADEKLGAFLHIDEEDALKQAETADTSLPLGGVPIALKDNIAVKGQPCTCASQILGNFISPYDAHVVEQLRKAGAILLGRTNMDEFAMGSSNENSSVKPARNPWDPSRIPGGSSGGSAIAVAARASVAALGSDTGGSIRQPAALCGCVALKPTYGRVSRYGLVAFASSLDQIGPMTKTTQDAALLLQAIAGHDPRENTNVPEPVPSFSEKLGESVEGLRIGIPREYFGEGIDPEVSQAVLAARDWYASNGASIVEVSLPHTEYAVSVYYIIATAEASANLARFDGIRYGKRAEAPENILDLYTRSRAEGFGEEVKRRIILGTYVLSSGYYDAYYNRAQKVRKLIRMDFEKAFESCDVILTPTSPTPAFKIGEKSQDPLQMYLADIFTIAANLAGIPAISLPCGFTDGGLPIGFQLLGKHFDEATLLQASHQYEQSHDWHLTPPLSL